MKYSLNPKLYDSMFAIPAQIVDKYLKFATGTQLKILLIFIKTGGEDLIKVVSEKLNINETQIIESLEYWEQCGVLVNNNKKQEKPIVEESKKRDILIVAKPSREDAIRRMEESKDIQFMFSEVQEKLGRLITHAEMSTLVWLHDNQGLPVPVILMSIQYAVNEGKTNFSYIEKMCIDWAKNDINTLEKAEERINQLYMQKTAWNIVRSAFGIENRKPSANEQKYSHKWINEYGFNKDILMLAYDMCIDAISKVRFSYINKILEKWYKAGVKSIEDISKVEESGKTNKSTKKYDVSYDLDKISNKFNNFD